MDFDRALNYILKFEGGFVDDPSDKGGATNKGITLRTLQLYYPNSTKEDLKKIQDTTINTIYYNDYWKGKFDKLPNCLWLQLFNTTVMSGYTAAISALHVAVKYPATGVLDTNTLSKVLNTSNLDLMLGYTLARVEKFIRICIANPTQIKFLVGWVRREITVLTLSLKEMYNE